MKSDVNVSTSPSTIDGLDSARIAGLLAMLVIAASGCGSCGESAVPATNQRAEPLKTEASASAPGSADACRRCAEAACRNYKRLGVDVYAGCLENSDAAKTAACKAAVECGHRTHCASSKRGPEECYCGAASTEECAGGQGISGPCRAEFEGAAGQAQYEWVTTHFGDRSLALGNAVFLLKCERDACKQECAL